MARLLITFWRLLFGRTQPPAVAARRFTPLASAAQVSATIFLVLRRMRAPLIILIVIFAISVLGLTLIPGRTPEGNSERLGFFDAFYFMSYTATTIGFGEIPYPFSDAQRLWVMITIYLTVIGWAYAIGSLLSLLQDRAFRSALAVHHFSRKVSHLREPFLLLAGYGRTGQLLGRSFDSLGRRIVVLDGSDARIDSLDIDQYHADVPGLVGDARNPHHLAMAGLNHPYCEGVLALTDNDEVNLAVAMTAALLRPELPVLARTLSTVHGQRMRAFGNPTVINPFDVFGDYMRLSLRAPASYQLMAWLEAGPGAPLPARGQPPASGRWVVCGYGRLGRELTADLQAEGLEVTVIEPAAQSADGDPDGEAEQARVIRGDGCDPRVMGMAGVGSAVGVVAGTDNDTTNLSLISAARLINPAIFVAARQNLPESAPLFAAMNVDSLLVPTEVIAHEIYAQLSTPLLWRFLREMPGHGDAWAARVVDRLTDQCGHHLEALWKVKLGEQEAPALTDWLAGPRAHVGDLLRSPEERARSLQAVALLVQRRDECVLAPDDDFLLRRDDEILLAGRGAARRALQTTLMVDAVSQYVMFDRHIPSSWIWRRLLRTPA